MASALHRFSHAEKFFFVQRMTYPWIFRTLGILLSQRPMMGNFTITDAVASDIPMLISLLAELFSIEQDFVSDTSKQARGLELLISSPERGTIKVAKTISGEVIGMVSAQLVVSTAEGAPSAWIEDMVVGQDHRTQGIGRRLLDTVLDWARSKGATRAQLLVDLDNEPALGYYDHLGWQGTRLGARRIFL